MTRRKHARTDPETISYSLALSIFNLQTQPVEDIIKMTSTPKSTLSLDCHWWQDRQTHEISKAQTIDIDEGKSLLYFCIEQGKLKWATFIIDCIKKNVRYPNQQKQLKTGLRQQDVCNLGYAQNTHKTSPLAIALLKSTEDHTDATDYSRIAKQLIQLGGRVPIHPHYDELKDLHPQGQATLLTILDKERELTHQYYQTQLWQKDLEIKKAQSTNIRTGKRNGDLWLESEHSKKLKPNEEVCHAMQLLTE